MIMEEKQITEGLANIILSKLNELTILSKTYFNLSEAAIYIGASHDTVRRYMYSGELAYSKPSGGRIYISKEDLDKFLGKSRIATKEEIELSASSYLANNKR